MRSHFQDESRASAPNPTLYPAQTPEKDRSDLNITLIYKEQMATNVMGQRGIPHRGPRRKAQKCLIKRV